MPSKESSDVKDGAISEVGNERSHVTITDEGSRRGLYESLVAAAWRWQLEYLRGANAGGASLLADGSSSYFGRR